MKYSLVLPMKSQLFCFSQCGAVGLMTGQLRTLNSILKQVSQLTIAAFPNHGGVITTYLLIFLLSLCYIDMLGVCLKNGQLGITVCQ